MSTTAVGTQPPSIGVTRQAAAGAVSPSTTRAGAGGGPSDPVSLLEAQNVTREQDLVPGATVG
jgi:hypothetical protein